MPAEFISTQAQRKQTAIFIKCTFNLNFRDTWQKEPKPTHKGSFGSVCSY